MPELPLCETHGDIIEAAKVYSDNVKCAFTGGVIFTTLKEQNKIKGTKITRRGLSIALGRSSDFIGKKRLLKSGRIVTFYTRVKPC